MKELEKFILTDKRIKEVEALTPEERTKLCGRYGDGRCHIPCADKTLCKGFSLHNVHNLPRQRRA